MTVFRFFFCAHNPNSIGQRWQHIASWYVVGYIISLCNTGIPSLYYLIPLKIVAIALGWVFGNGSYMLIGQKNADIWLCALLSIRYSISGALFLILSLYPIKLLSLWLAIDSAVFLFGP